MASAHTVVQGDTLYTIAQQNGFPNWRTIYNHASNAALRVLRPNPHVLHPGDIVQIPDVPKRPTLEVPLDARTAIVRVPLGQQLFRLLLVDDDRQPLTNTAFTLTFAGGSRSGSTDANGMLREFIPVGATTVTLQVQQLKRDLDVGKLNPLLVTTTDQGASGAKGRLRNIGFAVVDVDTPSQLDLAEALRRFQSEQQLATSGQLDGATRTRLQRVHGS